MIKSLVLEDLNIFLYHALCCIPSSCESLSSIQSEENLPIVEEILIIMPLSFPSSFYHRWRMSGSCEACGTLSHINFANPAGLTARPLCCTTLVTWAGGSCICMKLVVRAISPRSSLCMSWATPKVATHTTSTGTTSVSHLFFSAWGVEQKVLS